MLICPPKAKEESLAKSAEMAKLGTWEEITTEATKTAEQFTQELVSMLTPTELQVKMMVSSTDLIASDYIAETVEWAHRHKQQMETAKKLYEDACEIIKAYMQKKEILISADGVRLATYKQEGKRTLLDTDALKLNFADVYDICLITKDGNRPLRLK